MKPSRLMIVPLILLAAANLGAQEIGRAAPDFRFEKSWNLPASATSIAGLRGHTVLLEFWATW